MITLQNSVITQVSNEVNGLLIFEPGQYTFTHLLWIKGYTNSPVVLDIGDGSKVTVDNYGWVSIVPAPSVVWLVSMGFMVAFATVGAALVIRRAFQIVRAVGTAE